MTCDATIGLSRQSSICAGQWTRHDVSQSSITDLALRIVCAQSAASELQTASQTQALARVVLERAFAKLERRLGTRVVLLRDLPRALTLPAQTVSALRDEHQQRLATAVACALGPAIDRARGRDDRSGIVVFDDEAHRLAHFLELSADRSTMPWFHSELARLEISLGTIAQQRQHVFIPTLARLATRARLLEVMAVHNDSAIEHIATALSTVGGPGVLFAHPSGSAHPPAAAIVRYIRQRLDSHHRRSERIQSLSKGPKITCT